MTEDTIVRVQGLTKEYKEARFAFRRTPTVVAVDRVSLEFPKGRTTAIVGESGSGKTTLGECILLLRKPDQGSIFFKGRDLSQLRRRELREGRKGMQVVFQDPFSSLNPKMSIMETLVEAVQAEINHNELAELISKTLIQVGLSPDATSRRPQEFSGGERQRIAIARALIGKPSFVVLDEPTSSLDVSIQLQILNLLRDLQESLGVTYMFITHNLSVAKYMSHMVAVMFAGRIIEQGDMREIVEKPRHPYTASLLSSIPGSSRSREAVLRERSEEGVVAHTGCRFRYRCPYSKEKCEQEPELREAGRDHLVRCHFFEDLSL